MKKSLLIAAIALVCGTLAYAQPRAIGGRLGAFDGVSYEHALGENNMIEIEAGLSIDGRTDYWLRSGGASYHGKYWGRTVQAAFTYDWIDPFGAKFPWEHKGEWHWYLGVGAAGGFGWEAYNAYGGASTNWGFAGAAGRAGVEFDFWFPLQLSIDFRPTLGASMFDTLGDGIHTGLYWEMTCFALGVRYRFH